MVRVSLINLTDKELEIEIEKYFEINDKEMVILCLIEKSMRNKVS